MAAVLVIFAALVVFILIPGGEPKITIEKARIIPEEAIKHVVAAYMLIINDGKGSDRLIGCDLKEFPSSWGELHDVVGGRMVKVEKIKIPADEITVLKGGKHHLMFYNVPDNIGDDVTIILKFKKSGTMEVKAHIRP